MGRPASAVTHISFSTAAGVVEQLLPADVKAIHIYNTDAAGGDPFKFAIAEKGLTVSLASLFYQVEPLEKVVLTELALLGRSFYHQLITGAVVVKLMVLS